MVLISELRAEYIYTFGTEHNKMVQTFLANTLDEYFCKSDCILLNIAGLLRDRRAYLGFWPAFVFFSDSS